MILDIFLSGVRISINSYVFSLLLEQQQLMSVTFLIKFFDIYKIFKKKTEKWPSQISKGQFTKGQQHTGIFYYITINQ